MVANVNSFEEDLVRWGVKTYPGISRKKIKQIVQNTKGKEWFISQIAQADDDTSHTLLTARKLTITASLEEEHRKHQVETSLVWANMNRADGSEIPYTGGILYRFPSKRDRHYWLTHNKGLLSALAKCPKTKITKDGNNTLIGLFVEIRGINVVAPKDEDSPYQVYA